MRSFVWALIILSLLFAFVIVFSSLLFEESRVYFDDIRQFSEDENLYLSDSNQEQIKSFSEKFEKQKNLLLLMMPKECVREIEDLISQLHLTCKRKDYDAYLILKWQLMEQVEEIMGQTRFRFERIV